MGIDVRYNGQVGQVRALVGWRAGVNAGGEVGALIRSLKWWLVFLPGR